MPMICFLASSPLSQRRFAAFATTCALAIATGTPPTTAHAQFNGDSGSDLTAATATDVTRINDTTQNDSSVSTNATTRLRQTEANNASRKTQSEPGLLIPKQPYVAGEFEQYVQRLQGAATVRHFGENLVTDDAIASATQDPLPSIPGDYIIRPGDEIALAIWGTVNADLQVAVDRAGRISVPRVGAINVAGLRNADLADAITRRVAQTFKNFQLTATLGQVRAIRVFVSGYVQRPGTVTVSGLSSVLHAIMRAGGPSAAGSFRDIHLRRAGQEAAVFDLYDLLLKGARDTDRLVQPDDVIFIGPVGTQVAVLGSVNQQAIYELRSGQTLEDALAMAGGFTAVADRSRVSIERLAERNTGRIAELSLPAHARDQLDTGDVIRAFSVVSAAQSQALQNDHVRIEGEVLHPGDYILPPGSHITDALRAAGGMTQAAYVYGTDFSRDSVRKSQQINYDRALNDLETDITKIQANQRVASADDLNGQTAAIKASARLLERLRQIRPTGRVVLQLSPDAMALPDLALEDGDTISIPTRGSSVGIFGSVFNIGSFVFVPGHTTQQYLALAGGPTRSADKTSIFMIRANGSVISSRQGASFWRSGNDLSVAIVQPGDTLFVPDELNKSTFVQDAKDWTQILYQFGLGIAGIKSLGL